MRFQSTASCHLLIAKGALYVLKVFPAFRAAKEPLRYFLAAVAVVAQAGVRHRGLGPVSQGNLNYLLLKLCRVIQNIRVVHSHFPYLPDKSRNLIRLECFADGLNGLDTTGGVLKQQRGYGADVEHDDYQ